LRKEAIAGFDNVRITAAASRRELTIRYRPPGPVDSLNIFVGLGTHQESGAAVLPFARNTDGSTVFLPFNSDLLLTAEIRADQIRPFIRRWRDWRWTEREIAMDLEFPPGN
jgi:hypothetical protein